MTLPNFGKILPVQGYLLELTGYVLTRKEGPVIRLTGKKLDKAKEKARNDLVRLTGQDFGYDVDRWYEFLILGGFGLTHPFGYEQFCKYLNLAGYATTSREEVELRLNSRTENS